MRISTSIRSESKNVAIGDSATALNQVFLSPTEYPEIRAETGPSPLQLLAISVRSLRHYAEEQKGQAKRTQEECRERIEQGGCGKEEPGKDILPLWLCNLRPIRD